VKSNLHLVELTLGVIEVKLKVVELVLKKVESGVMVHHHVLKLLDLALELGDQSTPARKLVTGLTKLLVSQLDGQVQSLSLVNQLSGGIALESLEMVETVQAQRGRPECPTGLRVATVSTLAILSSQSGSAGSCAGNNPNADRTTSSGC